MIKKLDSQSLGSLHIRPFRDFSEGLSVLDCNPIIIIIEFHERLNFLIVSFKLRRLPNS